MKAKTEATEKLRRERIRDTMKKKYADGELSHFKEIAYQCDIFIPSLNLIIEADGDYWHNFPFGREIDRVRTKELEEKGFRVIRLWENEIKQMDLLTFQEILENKL